MDRHWLRLEIRFKDKETEPERGRHENGDVTNCG